MAEDPKAIAVGEKWHLDFSFFFLGGVGGTEGSGGLPHMGCFAVTVKHKYYRDECVQYIFKIHIY